MSVLPVSLSPHISILTSEDLDAVLAEASLLPFPDILQSFSPLPQVTTRTTSLVSVSHSSFALRFSDLRDVESACQEDQEQRAVRTLDWLAGRIHKDSQKWVGDFDNPDGNDQETPWWDELCRYVEGDLSPSKLEAWNHPVALMLAVSTMAPNPLQAIATLHARALDLPSWVDRNILRCTLIVHPQNSSLSDEESKALFNAVKRQYGLESYLLPLDIPITTPVPFPPILPRPRSFNSHQFYTIPLMPQVARTSTIGSPLSLRMSDRDNQRVAKFIREFLIMGLLPWMEKCVLEWSENFTSSRRLPSRLFSSTRRLFGSSSLSPSFGHQSPTLTISSRTPSLLISDSGDRVTPPSQTRRLAEFATILGDFKLALSIWESLRKEGKSGFDILPLLLSPSNSISLYASNALSNLRTLQEPRAVEQLFSLKYAVRWEVGIPISDFISFPLEGDCWLVWAAGDAEAPTAALLLARAALLSTIKQARRRAVFWYLSASSRLEKSGAKSLSLYFLRKAHRLHVDNLQKALSPSFWESEGSSETENLRIDVVLAGIEHSLARLFYETGNIAGAARCFLGLLRRSSVVSSSSLPHGSPVVMLEGSRSVMGADKIYLDDFNMTFLHFLSISGESAQLDDFKLPFTFCCKHHISVNIYTPDASGSLNVIWESRRDTWKAFCKSRGLRENLMTSGKAYVNEPFSVELVLCNPLQAEVNISNFTIVLQDLNSSTSLPNPQFVETQVIHNIIFGPNELRKVNISVTSRRSGTFAIERATYDFLSILPSSELLSSRGRRLQDTPIQRQKATYAADVYIKVDVEEIDHRVVADFVEDQHLVLAQGERRSLSFCFHNTGSHPVEEIWMVFGQDDIIWMDEKHPHDYDGLQSRETLLSRNSLAGSNPQCIFFSGSDNCSFLNPGDNMEFPTILYADAVGIRELCILLVYREVEANSFHSTCIVRQFQVYKLMDVSFMTRPSQSLRQLFLLNLELCNVSSDEIELRQVTTVSAMWKGISLLDVESERILAGQILHLSMGVNRRSVETFAYQEILNFICGKFENILQGNELESSNPPVIDLLCCPYYKSVEPMSNKGTTSNMLSRSIRNHVYRTVRQSFPQLPTYFLPYIFPLHNPAAMDFVISWTFPIQNRMGYIFVPGPQLGALHEYIGGTLRAAENAKAKRSIYTESEKGRNNFLRAAREMEWNAEMNPVTLMIEEPGIISHDFNQGSCHIHVRLTIRNYSLSNCSRFVLSHESDSSSRPPNTVTAPYVGHLTFRGVLDPAESRTFRANVRFSHPGRYNVGMWYLDVEVLEASPCGKVRHRYRQKHSPGDSLLFIICNSNRLDV